MRFGKDGFDTKNPGELVLPTFWVTNRFIIPFVASTTVISLIFLGWIWGTISTAIIPTVYLTIAFVFNPKQLFLKHQRKPNK